MLDLLVKNATLPDRRTGISLAVQGGKIVEITQGLDAPAHEVVDAQGLLAIRSHVDICDPRLLAVEALLEVKRRIAPYLDLQLVAFPQDGALHDPHGMTVAFGQDCVMDPWYSLGSGDMLEVASMGLHVAQMTSQAAMRPCFDAVTTSPARIMRLEGYGLEAGCHADFVVLQARDPVDAIRLRATRLKVFRRGKLVAQTPAATASLHLSGRPGETSWMHDPRANQRKK